MKFSLNRSKQEESVLTPIKFEKNFNIIEKKENQSNYILQLNDALKIDNNTSFVINCSLNKSSKFAKIADIDMCSVFKNKDIITSVVYYNLPSHRGITLLKEENTVDKKYMEVDMAELPKNMTDIYFALMIYNEDGKKQDFSKLKSVDITLIGEDGSSLCTTTIELQKCKDSCLLFARLIHRNDAWYFIPAKVLSNDNISNLKVRLK